MEKSISLEYGPSGSITSSVQSSYTSDGYIDSEYATFYQADGSVGKNFNTVQLLDGTSITVESMFAGDGTVAGQDLSFYQVDGTPSIIVTATETETPYHSLDFTQGFTFVGDGSLVDTFTLDNIENAASVLLHSVTSTVDDTGSIDVTGSVTACFEPLFAATWPVFTPRSPSIRILPAAEAG